MQFLHHVAHQTAATQQVATQLLDELDVHHAWLVENLDGRRVRILTQETQKGKPAEELHNAKPNPMINGHQDWLDSLVEAARKAKQA